MAKIKLAILGDLIDSVDNLIDNTFTSKEEKLELKNELVKSKALFLSAINASQSHTNTTEANSGSLFIAGWRPAIGWIGALALFYQFIVYPILLWFNVSDTPPAPFDYSLLYSIITGMLGIAGLRSFDKIKKVDTKNIKK
ncbi:MAG: 3TM-type holin [candidate division KSB1 bacterium]|nr:3TM-type holin [candidate division KSB1 bacterium]